MKKIIVVFLFLSQFSFSQNFNNIKIKKIKIPDNSTFYFPVLNNEGNKLLLTKQNFNGLYLYDMNTKNITEISDKQGAGYRPIFSDNDLKVFFRENDYEGMRKISAVCEYDIKSNRKSIIENKTRNVSTPQIFNNQLFYTVDNKEKRHLLNNKINNTEGTWVLIENQKIALYINGKKKILSPKGNGNYIWPSLSPDKTKLLFTFAGHGTFISDLDGNVLSDLGYLNAPKWYNNNWVAGMKETDDGDRYTASDIFVVSSDGKQIIQLTKTKKIIELYPNCSAKNSKIVCHTPTGEIYSLEIRN